MDRIFVTAFGVLLTTALMAQAAGESGGVVCGVGDSIARLSSTAWPHAPEATDRYSCSINVQYDGFRKHLRFSVVNPLHISPLRNTSIVSSAVNVIYDLGAFIFREEENPTGREGLVPDLRHFVEAFHVAEYFHTFVHPQGVMRIFQRRSVTVQVHYHRRDHRLAEYPVSILRLVEPSTTEGATVICQQQSSNFVPAQWKRWWQGDDWKAKAEEDRTVVEQCTFSVPAVVGGDFMVKLNSNFDDILDMRSNFTKGTGVRIVVKIAQIWDMWLLRTIFLIIVLHLLQPFIVQNLWVQLFVAALFGALVVIAVLMYFVLREMQKTMFGKIGAVAVFSVGGFAALTEGFLSGIISYVIRELPNNLFIQIAGVIIVVAAPLTCYFFFKNQLPIAAKIIIWGAKDIGALWLTYENPEFVLFASFAWLVLRVSGRLPGFGVFRFPNSDDPRDSFPADVYNATGSYHHPVAVGISGRTAKDRLDRYAKVGADTTRVELAKLRAYLAQHPETYTKRVTNPNEVAQWVGPVAMDDE